MDYQQAVLENYQQKNFLKCLTLIEDCPVAKAKESPHYKVLKAACYINLHIHVDLTHQILDELLVVDDNNEFAYYCKGLAYFNEKNFEEAIKCLDKAFDLNPKTMPKAKELRDKAERFLEPAKNESGEVEISMETNPDSARLTCEICRKVFASFSNMRRHRLLHSSEKPHRCTWCKSG